MRTVRKPHAWIVITFTLVLLILALAFFFSAQSAAESSEVSGKVTRFLLELFSPEFCKLTAAEQAKRIREVHGIIRKMAHFTEFAALGFSLMLHLRVVRYYYPNKIRVEAIWTLLIGALCAAADETHQIFSEARGPSPRDVLIDTSGVICGILLLCVLWRIVAAIRRARREKITERDR